LSYWVRAAFVVALVALVLSIQLHNESRLLQELEDSGHALLFGMAAFVLLPDRRAGWRVYVTVAIAATALGIGTELMQWIEGKDAEIADVLRDAAGTAVFLGIAAALQHQRSSWMRRLTIPAGLAVMVSIFLPPLVTASAIAYRWHKFPVIADFTSPLDTRFCTASNAQFRRTSSKDRLAAQIEFGKKSSSSAFVINGPFPDWSGYKSLCFRVDSDLRDTIRVNLRIHDAQHNNDYDDRYNAELLINPGRNEIKIPMQSIERAPAHRRMNMASIRAIVLFVAQPRESFSLLVDDFRLE
jgi:VanZ family protein